MQKFLLIVDEEKDIDGFDLSPYSRVFRTHFYKSSLNKNFKQLLDYEGSDVLPSFITEHSGDADCIIKYGTYGLPDSFDSFESAGVYLPKKGVYDIIGHDTDASVMSVAFQLFDKGYDFTVLTRWCYSSGGTEMHRMAVELMKRNFGRAVVEND